MERFTKAEKRRNLALNLTDLILITMLYVFLGNLQSIGEALVYAAGLLYLMARAGIYIVKFMATASKNWNLIKKFCKDLRNID